MNSIIDEVAKTEEAAQKLKMDALAEQREKTAQLGADIEKRRVLLQEKERASLKGAMAKAEEDGEKIAADIIKERLITIEEECLAAEKRLDKGVEYLLGRVEDR